MHEFQVTPEEFGLDNTYNNPNSSEDSEAFNLDNPIEVSVGSYNSEEIFRPGISDPELNWSVTIDDNIERNPNNWSQSGTFAGLPITISYDDQGSSIAETTTYYRVFTEADETSELGADLAAYYLENIGDYAEGAQYSQSIMAVEGNGNYCQDLLEDFAEEYNLEQYDPKEGIPLTKDGEAVYQIEMLTVSNLKSQIYVNPSFGAGGTFYLDGPFCHQPYLYFYLRNRWEGAPVALQEPTCLHRQRRRDWIF